MSIKSIIIGATVAGISLGSFGLAAGEASAAVMAKQPMHHGLACKAGYTPHKIKVHGKWRTECVRVHMHMHKPMVRKP